MSKLKAGELRRWRRNVQVVFQDPYSSLNPRMRVGEIVAEPLEVHPDVSRGMDIRAAGPRAARAGRAAGRGRDEFPHQFSGGQRQRIGIARAIALNPDVLLCDEPVSALDLSVQAQVVNLLMRLQRELGLSIIFVAHDLSVVRHVSDRVAVMYLGRVAELGEHQQVYDVPAHPVHAGAAVGRARPGPAGPQADRAGRRPAVAGHATVRLPLPHPLPARGVPLQHRGTAAPPIPSGQTVSCHFAEEAQTAYTASLERR